jgi:hypothetical protein
MSPETSALFNKTCIGGKALRQNTALTLILSRKGLAKNGSGDVTGNLITCRVAKNSLGHDNVKFFYELRTGFYNDTLTHMDSAINFNIGFATMCAEQKWMSTSVKGSKFSSPVLGVTEVSADEFCEAFNDNQEVKFNLGKQLGINGYIDVVDNIKSTIEKNYHTEHDDSIESEIELGRQMDQEALEALRQKMEQGNGFSVAEQPDSSPEENAHLNSIIEDIDNNQELNSSEEFTIQDE